MSKVDLSDYKTELGFKHQLTRLIWQTSWFFLARPFPRRMANTWKVFLLKCFGAQIDSTAVVYSSVKVYAPWMLKMDAYSCLAPEVDCYNVDMVVIGKNATVSQKAYLCTASHDVTNPKKPLTTAPIIIEDQAWIAASAYIGPGVTICQGAVVGATASVYKDVESWTIVGGNPAKFLKKRVIHG
jgi:putative colanic acid biosynthesis acetyltransferase WcaF